MPAVSVPIHAPEFVQGEWLNSPPLTMAGLRGQVVLLDFWDYTCVNCLRTFPYQRAWWEMYRGAGLLVVGVHTPEFGFARDVDYVRRALAELRVDWPVLIDNDYANWQAWATRYWPTKYLVDRAGCLRFFQYGEGQYHKCEATIRTLLQQDHAALTLPPAMADIRVEDRLEAVCAPVTPQLYLGMARSRLGNVEQREPERAVVHAPAASMSPDTAYLSGHWRHHPESATLLDGEGAIDVRYNAREVHLVLAPPPRATATLAVEQDGRPLAADARGDDVAPRDGAMTARVDYPRLVNLVRNPEFGEHDLHIRLLTPGTSAYSLAFVGECRVPRLR